MRTTTASLVLIFALLGIALSGYLTWQYYQPAGCHVSSFLSCSGGGKPVTILRLPTCLYGLVMFSFVFVLGLVALAKPSIVKAILILGVIGALFAASLSVYELWIKKTVVSGLPSCVYGFFLYLGIVICSALAVKGRTATSPLS